ncbi:hypothetical protein SDRG_08404 [Saprolegnia diclina VS20]|uniref:Uncharacterized protein n=1 Tax=Saprolegnia diclina (strain VS20) TaxID=1156394 RepID=T0QHH8_SAPDV|nr:hypothetical protein SDRG_08404 [Saprolegnia diclina VS20]EQC34201.1 hypothetical protein SDRG_08404 [Saprolegnia diclina VS20]|eukprot:XP_008612513.1 hypothetical protein SDRG_08404 [Saprolegnia diclina VS20]
MTDDIALAIVDDVLRSVEATRVVRHAATRVARDMWEMVHLSARVSPSPACMQRIPEEPSTLVLDSRAAQCIPSKAHKLRWTIASSPTGSDCTASSLSVRIGAWARLHDRQIEPPPPVCTRTAAPRCVKSIKATTKTVVIPLLVPRSTTALHELFSHPLPKMLPEITVGATPVYVPPPITPLCTVVSNQDDDHRPFLTSAMFTPTHHLLCTDHAVATRPASVPPPKVEPRARLPSTTSTRRLSFRVRTHPLHKALAPLPRSTAMHHDKDPRRCLPTLRHKLTH